MENNEEEIVQLNTLNLEESLENVREQLRTTEISMESTSSVSQYYDTNISLNASNNYHAIVNVPSELIAVDNAIGDEDYVIDIETAPVYRPFEEVVNEVTNILSSEDIESITAHINEILEDVEETEESNIISAEDLVIVESIVNEIQLLPENSDTILVSQTTSRFSGAEWYEQIQKEEVILAGIGGIGSYIGFLLGRLSIKNLVLYDNDTVDIVNLSGQLYSMADVGRNKVDALGSMLGNYANFYRTTALSLKFEEGMLAGKVMICGFDNMVARKVYFNAWINLVNSLPEDEKKNCLFIDGRLAAEEYQILCMRGDDSYSINKYHEEFLFTDAQADITLCSYKQTTFMANQIASTMVNLFINFVANKCEPIIDRYLPFYIEYNAETMFFKTIT